MVGLRTICACLIAALAGVGPAPSRAAPLTPEQQLHAFATCAGRYSALTEHYWLVDGPASEVPARRRDRFADLMRAVQPDSGVSEQVAMGWRVAAKAEQRRLLGDALFAGRAGSGKLAQAFLADCDQLVPGA
ncbi:hypothetical protein [Frigidibacter sp. ROC022]|uniref:hypothetical protein n=1 Tax=Frigidibacter sp. ROC022 TaxID=2971796 RepID=UPI00215A7A9B|nr:hypothetical protein [Frigidibacter sp. ROC022]MCR8725332.1 hypothetical protein [Frigidibacter sp. ROC022]